MSGQYQLKKEVKESRNNVCKLCLFVVSMMSTYYCITVPALELAQVIILGSWALLFCVLIALC